MILKDKTKGELIKEIKLLQKQIAKLETIDNEHSKALRESEEMYRALFTESRDAIMILLPEDEVFSGNPEAIKMFGCRDAKDLTSRTPGELSPEYQPDGALSLDKARKMMMLALEKGSNFFEWMYRRVDGTEFPTTVLLSRVGKNGNVFLQATVRDITERKAAEKVLEKAYKQLKETRQELIQAEKMAALGRFSTLIAHEVKNPLGIILGGLELLKTNLAHDDEEAGKTLVMVRDAVLRANSILESLLQYARPSDLKIEVVEASHIVMPVLNMVKTRASAENITIDTEFTQGLRISVDKNQMHQVFLNIVNNAMEAMPKGGKISIKVYKEIVPNLSSEKMSCIIEMADTGAGISQKNLTRVAEPFFTTKERGIGTGLGLFVVKMIVENHNGKLLVESIEDKGTIVRIILPMAD